MRMVLLLVAAGCAGVLAGCPGEEEAQVEPSSSARQFAPTAGDLPPGGEIPPCDTFALAIDGYEPMVLRYVDLDGDGIEEVVVGYQFVETDELGEPLEMAYFTLAKWDGSDWGEWFSIPAPGGESYVDSDSIVVTGDINADGIVELGLYFYGFGVSSRPESLYLWQVIDEGLEPVVEGDAIELTSDDAGLIADITDDFPGMEIIIARAIMGDEAHFAPHRYSISIYAWNEGIYQEIDGADSRLLYDSPDAALDAFTGGTFR